MEIEVQTKGEIQRIVQKKLELENKAMLKDLQEQILELKGDKK